MRRASASKKLSPSDQADLDKFVRRQVEHTRQNEVLERAFDSLENARSDCNMTLLVGPTGVGKTNLIETVKDEAERQLRAQPDHGRIAFLKVSADPPTQRTFSFNGLYEAVLEEAEEIGRDRKRLPNHLSTQTSDARQRAARNVLIYRRPFAFCIDEAQHMVYASAPDRQKAHFDNLKKLADATPGVPLLLAGTGEILELARLSGQTARRLHPIAFLPYSYTETKEHARVVKHFFDNLPIDCTFALRDKYQFFFEGSVGSVGVLKPWFDRVLRKALSEGRRTLRLEDFEAARLTVGQLTTIGQEIEDVRARLADLEGDIHQLRVILGTAKPKTQPAGVSAKPFQPKLRPGQRKLSRDPVGISAA